MRSIIKDNSASAGVFVIVIMLFVVFATLDFVIDSSVDNSISIQSAFEEKYGDVLGSSGLPYNWSDLDITEREDYLDDLHGCDNTLCWGNPFDDYTDWIGVGRQWEVKNGGDGVNMHQNDWYDLIYAIDDEGDEGDTGIFFDMLVKFFSVIALDFNFFTHLDWFAWIIKFPMWSALVYCIIKALPFT